MPSSKGLYKWPPVIKIPSCSSVASGDTISTILPSYMTAIRSDNERISSSSADTTAVFRNMGQAKLAFHACIHRRDIYRLARLPILHWSNRHLPACDFTHPRQRLNEFGLPIAFDTGDTKNLTRMYIKAHTMQDL